MPAALTHPPRRTCGRTALLALPLLACSTTVQGGAEPDAPKVMAVEIEGGEGVPEDDVVEGLLTQPPSGIIRKVYRRLDRLGLVQDIARIEAYYHRQGYFSAEVEATRVEPTRGGVEVTFEVDEGEPTRVTDLGVEGLPADLRDADPLAERSAPLRRGSIYRHDHYEELKEWLVAWLAHQGYPHARIDGEVAVDRDDRTASIKIEIDRGPEAEFGQTVIRGLEHTPHSVIRHRLDYEPGDEFDPARLERTQGRLYQLGLFGAVRMDYEREGRPEVTEVRVSVTEAGRHEMRLGGGVRVEGGFQASDLKAEIRGRADYTMRRFLDPRATLRIDARPAWQFLVDDGRSGPAGEATATVTRIDLFAPLLTGMVMVGYEADEYEAYSLRGPVARTGLSRPFLRDDLLVGLSYRFRQARFLEVSPAVEAVSEEIGLTDPYRVGAIEENVAYDLRNDPLSPRRGFYAQLVGVHGARGLGGTSSFHRGTAEMRGYLPIGDRLVLAARGLYGRALGGGDLPITERFFDGGAAGHRGFGFRELAPFVTDEEGNSFPVGGEERVLGSGEVRYDLMKLKGYPFGVVGFVDAGDVVDEVGALELGDLHYAAGLGLRYDPIIAFRLDVGYRLNRHGAGEPDPGSRFAFHFSLGQAF